MTTVEEHLPGFQFDNFARNEKLVAKGLQMPRAMKTGTTIAGIVYKDGVVLGADTRATAGDIVGDKHCNKIHYLQPNMYCGGAGTAADLDMTTQLMSRQLELHRLHTGRQVPVIAANRMFKQMLFRYQGHIGAYLLIGGVDKFGSHLLSIHAAGSSYNAPFDTSGSGCLAAMTVFEARWRPNMELEEAKQLVHDAIAAGVLNDMGSGSSVDLCVITKDGATHLRDYNFISIKGERKGKYDFPKGVTEVLSTERRPIEIVSEEVRSYTSDDDDKMDTA